MQLKPPKIMGRARIEVKIIEKKGAKYVRSQGISLYETSFEEIKKLLFSVFKKEAAEL